MDVVKVFLELNIVAQSHHAFIGATLYAPPYTNRWWVGWSNCIADLNRKIVYSHATEL